MAEGQDDARVQEIRARHVAAGDPGDPHCAWCSGPDYPIWPCDVADLLEVIDAQRAIMDAQGCVSEQHRTRVQEVASRLDALTAERDELRADALLLIEVRDRAVDGAEHAFAERDAALAWSARWKAVAKRLWRGIHKSIDQNERLVARMLKAEAERDDLTAERDELLADSRKCWKSMARAMTAMARDVVTINDLKARLAAAEAALLAVGVPLINNVMCWCQESRDMAYGHSDACRQARAVLAGSREPATTGEGVDASSV